MNPLAGLLIVLVPLVILSLAVATSDSDPLLRVVFLLLAGIAIAWAIVRYQRDRR